MTTSVLCDTSFLISLFDANRPHHAVAERYYRYCLGEGIPLFLSTLVAAEYGVRQRVADLPLRSFRVLPFNLPHAIKTAELDFQSLRDSREDARAVVKEDIKLLAQATVEGISHVLTEDARTLYKYGERLRQAGKTRVQSIKLVNGFDSSWFKDGQREMIFGQNS